MREESHLDEMRSAIRGDFERLAARRGEQDLLRVAEPETEDESPEARLEAPEPVRAVDPGAPAAPLDEPEPAEPEPGPEEPEAEEQQPEPEPPPRRSWLGRMFST